MNWLDMMILAVIQGIAEFLPISSSGHLVIVSEIMYQLRGGEGLGKPSADVNIMLHAGTLLSILVYYHRRVLRLLSDDWRVIPLLIVGTIPAAVIGITVKKFCEPLLESALVAGLMLPVTGGLLLWATRRKEGTDKYTDMSYLTAIIIGVFQALALLPGISRSGSTIAGGLFRGQKRDSAATFSFLLAIPAILGATVLEAKDMLDESPETNQIIMLLSGAFVAFLVGLVSLSWLIKLIEGGRLHWFAYWCIPVGVLVTLWQLYVLANG